MSAVFAAPFALLLGLSAVAEGQLVPFSWTVVLVAVTVIVTLRVDDRFTRILLNSVVWLALVLIVTSNGAFAI